MNELRKSVTVGKKTFAQGSFTNGGGDISTKKSSSKVTSNPSIDIKTLLQKPVTDYQPMGKYFKNRQDASHSP